MLINFSANLQNIPGSGGPRKKVPGTNAPALSTVRLGVAAWPQKLKFGRQFRPTRNKSASDFALAVTMPNGTVVKVADLLPKSAWLYSRNTDQFGASLHSAPPPITQPLRVLSDVNARPPGVMISRELSR